MIDGMHSSKIGIIGHFDNDDEEKEGEEEISRLEEGCISICRKGFTGEFERALRDDILMVVSLSLWMLLSCAVVSKFYLIVSVARNKVIGTKYSSCRFVWCLLMIDEMWIVDEKIERICTLKVTAYQRLLFQNLHKPV